MNFVLLLGCLYGVCLVAVRGSDPFDLDKCRDPRTPLRVAADGLNIDIGVATQHQFYNSSFQQWFMRKQFNTLVAENEFKMDNLMVTQDRPGSFWIRRPSKSRQMYGWANRNKMRTRGHTLFYHANLPQKVLNWTMNRRQWRNWARRYACSVMHRFKGVVTEYDVINEAFWHEEVDADGGSSNGNGLRQTFLLEKLGDDYIPFLFKIARKCDPDAKLYLNDYLIEYVNPKSTVIFEAVRKWRAQGVPIDGVGFQGHIDHYYYGSDEIYTDNFARFRAAGIELAFTELDIFHDCVTNPDHDLVSADLYYRFVRWAVQYTFSSVVVWGLQDSQSWINLNDVFPCKGNPLLFDGAFIPKPAFYSFKQALCDEKQYPGGAFPATQRRGSSTSGLTEDDFSNQISESNGAVKLFAADFNMRSTGAPHGAHAWNLWSEGYIEGAFSLKSHSRFVAKLRPQKAGKEEPRVKIFVDDQFVTQKTISKSLESVHVSTGKLRGVHRVKIEFVNDYFVGWGADRNVIVEEVTWYY